MDLMREKISSAGRRSREWSTSVSEKSQMAFTLRCNDLFDAMNRQDPDVGLRKGGMDLIVIKEVMEWFDEWEHEVHSGKISKDMFLMQTTAEGLRVTMRSTIGLTEHLLNTCGYDYVLTTKFNQNSLERFFAKIQHAACESYQHAYLFLIALNVNGVQPPQASKV